MSHLLSPTLKNTGWVGYLSAFLKAQRYRGLGALKIAEQVISGVAGLAPFQRFIGFRHGRKNKVAKFYYKLLLPVFAVIDPIHNRFRHGFLPQQDSDWG
jgi:hypothetical protein